MLLFLYWVLEIWCWALGFCAIYCMLHVLSIIGNWGYCVLGMHIGGCMLGIESVGQYNVFLMCFTWVTTKIVVCG